MAEGGNNSEGFTVTLNGVLDIPPDISSLTGRNPFPSDPIYCVLENRTIKTIHSMNSNDMVNSCIHM